MTLGELFFGELFLEELFFEERRLQDSFPELDGSVSDTSITGGGGGACTSHVTGVWSRIRELHALAEVL